MQTIKFYGASDDLVEVCGTAPGCDEYGSCDKIREFVVQSKSTEASLRVFPVYSGSWGFAVCPDNGDDYGMPEGWKIERSFGGDCAYSETLRIEGPDDIKVVMQNRFAEFEEEEDE